MCAGEYVAALRDALAARLLTADAAAAVEEYVLRPSPSAPFTVQPDHADGYTPAADRAAQRMSDSPYAQSREGAHCSASYGG